MTRPAVPPYSSSTIAMWTLRRWNSWSRSSIVIDSGTNTGVRSSDADGRPLGRPALEERQQVLRVQDADDLVDRSRRPGSGEWPSSMIRSIASSRVAEAGRATIAIRGTITSCRRRLAELDDRVDHLLLLGLEDALLAAALDDQPQLLGGDLGLGRRRPPRTGARCARVIAVRTATIGPSDAAQDVDRARERERERLGVGERERLGHELAEDDREQRQQDRDDDQGDALGGAAVHARRRQAASQARPTGSPPRTPRRGSR